MCLLRIGIFLVLSYEATSLSMMSIAIITLSDQQVTAIEPWKIPHSRVLQLLHMHQSRCMDNCITIPTSTISSSRIKQKDIIAFRELLDKKNALSEYFSTLPYESIVHLFSALNILSATQEIASVVAYASSKYYFLYCKK